MKKNIMLPSSVNEVPSNHQFNGIDFVKFLCAYMICIIHIPPFYVANKTDFFFYVNCVLGQCLCRIAVPFYFTVSGFLLFRKIDFSNVDTNRIKKYSLKTFRLFGLWTFLLFVGARYHLWYLGAVALAVAILGVLLKKNISLKSITVFSIVTFIIGLLGDSYYGFIAPLKNYLIPKLIIGGYELLFSTTRNGIFFGFIFVFMGAIFAQRRIVINSMIAIIGFFVSIIAMLYEVYLLNMYSHPKDYNMLISLLPATFFLFYIASHMNLKNNAVYGRLRTIGVIVFFSHLFVDFFVSRVIKFLTYSIGINLTGFKFPIIICLTTIFAMIIEHLSKKDGFDWLMYLYQ